MERALHDVHEMVGAGTLFPDEAGRPVLHLHAAFGRDDRVSAGCIRAGVTTWVVGEAVVIELVGSEACRRVDRRRASSCWTSEAAPESVSGTYLRSERSPGPTARPRYSRVLVQAQDKAHTVW